MRKDKLILNEDFVYDDGERESREWTIEKTGPFSFRGVSDNIIGLIFENKLIKIVINSKAFGKIVQHLKHLELYHIMP